LKTILFIPASRSDNYSDLCSGILNLVTPLTADLPFLGRRIQALWVSPVSVSIKKLPGVRFLAAFSITGNLSLFMADEAAGHFICSKNGLNALFDPI
jgi:hypothetical protein